MEGSWRFRDARVLTKAKLDPFLSQPLSAYLAAAKKHLAELKLVNLNDSLFCSGFLISHRLDTSLPIWKCGVPFISSDILRVCPHLHIAKLEIVYKMDITGLLILIRRRYQLTGCRQGVQTLEGGGA